MLEVLLSPIVHLMRAILELYLDFIPSAGLAILLLSLTFSLLLLKPRQWADRLERRVSVRMTAVDAQVRAIDATLRGERRFDAIEKIYQQNGYHPIQSVAVGAGLLSMLPVLIAAYFLFTSDGFLVGRAFLFIRDLSQPDGTLGSLNILPMVMLSVTVIDARLRFRDDTKAQNRFYVIALILFALVYTMPAGLVLYWTGNNLTALVLAAAEARLRR